MTNTNDILLIERYLDGDLSSQEKIDVETRLQLDQNLQQLLQEQLLLVEGIKRYTRKKDALQFLQRIEEGLPLVKKESTPIISIFSKKWMTIAASVVIIVAVYSYSLINGTSNQEIYTAYYDTYPVLSNNNVRGESEEVNNSFDQAMSFYETGNYEKALNLFTKSAVDNSEKDFYMASAYLAVGQTQKALTIFEKLEKVDHPFSVQNKWYLALSYLKMDRSKDAKLRLRELVGGNDVYAVKAQAILQEIN